MAVDVVGNMDDEGMAMWALPASERGAGRSSIIRRYDDDDAPLDGTAPAWSGTGSIEAQEGLVGGKGECGLGLCLSNECRSWTLLWASD